MKSEPNGALNLNRYFPASVNEATLCKRFASRRAGRLALSFGFSNQLELSLDGQTVYTGQHLWKPSPNWAERGYGTSTMPGLDLPLPAGDHELVARLRRQEYFGWGLILRLESNKYGELLPKLI